MLNSASLTHCHGKAVLLLGAPQNAKNQLTEIYRSKNQMTENRKTENLMVKKLSG